MEIGQNRLRLVLFGRSYNANMIMAVLLPLEAAVPIKNILARGRFGNKGHAANVLAPEQVYIKDLLHLY